MDTINEWIFKIRDLLIHLPQTEFHLLPLIIHRHVQRRCIPVDSLKPYSQQEEQVGDFFHRRFPLPHDLIPLRQNGLQVPIFQSIKRIKGFSYPVICRLPLDTTQAHLSLPWQPQTLVGQLGLPLAAHLWDSTFARSFLALLTPVQI